MGHYRSVDWQFLRLATKWMISCDATNTRQFASSISTMLHRNRIFPIQPYTRSSIIQYIKCYITIVFPCPLFLSVKFRVISGKIVLLQHSRFLSIYSSRLPICGSTSFKDSFPSYICVNIILNNIHIIKIKKLNLWLTAPSGATPVNQNYTTDWQMAVRRDNVISITLRQVY